MGTSKAQREGRLTVCVCGCGESFKAFPVYRNKSEGGGLRYPVYKRGHHPNCRTAHIGVPSWNAGLTKGDHPSIAKMGFQPGHTAYNDWSKINARFNADPDFKQAWRDAKIGQEAWNKGLKLAQYPNGIAKGAQHGNWKGGLRGFVDTAEWQRVRRAIQRRDKWTCQHCGDRNYKGRGSRIKLDVHHIIAVSENLALALEPSNLITLCRSCHFKTHNYGSKACKGGSSKFKSFRVVRVDMADGEVSRRLLRSAIQGSLLSRGMRVWITWPQAMELTTV